MGAVTPLMVLDEHSGAFQKEKTGFFIQSENILLYNGAPDLN